MTTKEELEILKENIQKPVNGLMDEIEELEKIINSPSTVVCRHLICKECEKALEEERKEREILQIKLDEKRNLFEKIKVWQ